MSRAGLCVLMVVMVTGSPAWASDLLVDDFNTDNTPSLWGRIYEHRLDAAGWDKPHGWPGNGFVVSNWEISGGTLNNSTASATTNYAAGECPATKWWTNPAPSSNRRRLRVSFDYGVGAGDTLTCHFWAVQTGRTPTTTFSWISNNQGWSNGNSGQNESVSTNGYAPYNLSNGSNPPTTGSISGSLTGTNTFVWEVILPSLGISNVITVGDIDTFLIAFAGNETGGGTTWVDNLSVTDWPPNLLDDDFSADRTPPDQWRLYDHLLDTGWNATRATLYFSQWDTTNNRMENPVDYAPTNGGQYVESESPLWQWWTNTETNSTVPALHVAFDYGVGAGDTLTCHFWAVQTGGPSGSVNFISNNEGWINGNSGQNKTSSSGGHVPYNLLDGANPPGNTGYIASLAGTGTFEQVIYPGGFGIPGVASLGDIDTFFLAFAGNEVGGGTTWIDDVSVIVGDTPTTVTYTVSSNWSSQDVGGHDTVVIVAGVTVTQDVNVAADSVLIDGTLEVEADTVVSSLAADVTIGASGALRFELGMLGITPLTLGGNLSISNGGVIEVDGTAYEGIDGYFPLLLTANAQASAAATNSAAFTGFAEREPALIQDTDGVWLWVIAPPAFSTNLCSLVPDSTVTADYSNTQFSATRAWDPSGSAWSLSLHEAHVSNTRLTQDVLGGGTGTTNQSWELRVARGGFVYSLRTPALGETVPPSYRSDGDTSPWNDEVWQGVAVGPLNDPGNGSPYFMHQSGVYMKDPILTEPFYSPEVAAHLDVADRSFTTVNWTPHAHINIYVDGNPSNDWKSYLLAYTRYKDLGQGVIEATLGYYNYGPDHLNWFNMPWGGVRRTSTEYAFTAQPGGTTWSDPVTNRWGTVEAFNLTGGWQGYSATSNGTTPALGFVFGEDADPLPPEHVGASWFRCGYAGGSFQTNETNWRNYFVSTVVRRYNLPQGNGIWSRTYFVLGDDMQDLSDRIADRGLVDVELSAFAYTESATPLIGYSFTGSGVDFRIFEEAATPEFSLYAHPVSDSFPVFEVIENDGSRYLTWNPYANGIVKPYDGTLAGIRLLGFAPRVADINSGGTSYAYESLENVLLAVPENYIADGEVLAVRVASSGSPASYVRGAGGDPSWSLLAGWWDDSSGTYQPSTQFPGALDTVTLNNGASAAVDRVAIISDMYIVNGSGDGTLAVNTAGKTLVITGAFDVGHATASGSGAVNQTAGSVSCDTLNVGGSGGSGVYSVDGGTLSVDDEVSVYTTGLLDIDGGAFAKSVAAAEPNRSVAGGGSIRVQSGAFAWTGGAVTNVVSMMNAMEISGGDVDLEVQFRLYNELKVVGDDADIDISWLGGLTGSSFVFELDGGGVSTIDVAGWMQLGDASITVDGSGYTGADADILLLDSLNLASTSTSVVVTGFAPGYVVSVIQDEASGRDWVRLTITLQGTLFRFR